MFAMLLLSTSLHTSQQGFSYDSFPLMFSFLACGDKSTDTSTPADSFAGMEFYFHSAEGFELIGEQFVLRFNEESTEMTFSAGCNSHSGAYALEEEKMVINEMTSSMMACDQELMDQDVWLAEFFFSSPSINHVDDQLIFTGADATLIFQDEEVAFPDLPLFDKTWLIDSYFDGDAALGLNINASPGVIFGSDGTIAVSTGCDDASGIFEDNNGVLRISIDVITDAACEGDLDYVERHILNVLNTGPVYEIDGNRLTLMAGELGLGAGAAE